MRTVGRRQVLWALGSGLAGVVCARRDSRAAAAAGDGLRDLALRLQKAPAAAAFEVAADAIRSGANPGTMLGAIFLCGVQDIRPRPHGILHSVMMVESSFQLVAQARPGEAWLPVLFNLDDLKRSQERDRLEDGDWALPRLAREATRPSSAEAARREFLGAMEAWDAPRAERAVVGLLPHFDHDAVFRMLWPLLARCYAFIGHKMIYAAQVERVLRRIGWRHAEPALRSLMLAVLVDRQTSAFDRSRELMPALPAGWQRGKETPAHAAILLRELRARAPAAAQELVVEAFKEGHGPQTVWDAFRLFGAELFLRRAGRSVATGRLALLPVHAVTVTNALGHAFRAADDDRTRRLLVLQAAGWLASMRDDLTRLVDLSMDGPGIDALESPMEASRPLPLDGASPGQVMAQLERRTLTRPRYLAYLRTSLFHKGQEHHQHKYAAAIDEESGRVHPRWASRLLATAVDYLAHPADGETEVYRRSVHALRRAGIAAGAS